MNTVQHSFFEIPVEDIRFREESLAERANHSIIQHFFQYIDFLSNQLTIKDYTASSIEDLPLLQFIAACYEFAKIHFSEEEAMGALIKEASTLAKIAAKIDLWVFGFRRNDNKTFFDVVDNALRHCRSHQLFDCEYVIRKLFVEIALEMRKPSEGYVKKALEFEKDHLLSLSTLVSEGVEKQDLYDYHLHNYLDLFVKDLMVEPAEEWSLANKFAVVRQELQLSFTRMTRAGNSLSDLVFYSAHFAFMHSREEWFFDTLPFYAKDVIYSIMEQTKDRKILQKLALQDLLLDWTEMRLGATKENLRKYIERLVCVEFSSLSATDFQMVSFLRTSAMLQYAKYQDNDSSPLLKNILFLLEKAIKRGSEEAKELSFSGLFYLSCCRFTYAFYSMLCGGKESKQRACKMFENLLADARVDEQQRKGSRIMLECFSQRKDVEHAASSFVVISGKSISLLEKLKLLILGQPEQFMREYLGIKKEELSSEMLSCMKLSKESAIWEFGKKRLLAWIENQEYENLKSYIILWMYYHEKKAWKQFDLLVNPRGERYVDVDFSDSSKIASFLSLSKDSCCLPSVMAACLLKDFSLVKIGESMKNVGRYLQSLSYGLYSIFNASQQFKGKLDYATAITNMFRFLSYKISSNNEVCHIFGDFKTTRATRKHIQELRHYIPIMKMIWNIIEHNYFLMRNLPQSNREYDLFYDSALRFCINAVAASTYYSAFSQENAVDEILELYLFEVNKASLHGELLLIQKYQFLSAYHLIAKSFYSTCEEEKMYLIDQAMSVIPDTIEQFDAEYGLLDLKGKYSLDRRIILLHKASHLVMNQQVEAGINLFISINAKNHLSKLAVVISDVKVVHFSIDPEQLKTTMPVDDVDEPQHPDPVAPLQRVEPSFSLTKESRELAKESLLRQEAKKKLKEARVASKSLVKEEVPVSEKRVESISLSPVVALTKKKFDIYMLFWLQNDPGEGGPWEVRSYRNDVKITRCQFLHLIKALGGKYSKSRGHGSHSIAHFPKLELNNCEIGVSDYEEGELLITLTNDTALKRYQISQIRKVLIAQGYTPDRIAVRNEN